jgi:Secretion system C-terminal sorting domain
VKKKFTYVFLALSALFISNSMFAQPANDDPCNATALIIGGGSVAFNDSLATALAGEVAPTAISCATSWCEVVVTNSVWFSFVAPATGIINCTTCLPGNTIDTQMAIYSVVDCNDFSTYTLLGANDDQVGGCASGATTYASTVYLQGLTPGTTYYVQIDGYNAADGASEIEIDEVTAPTFVQFLHNSADTSLSVVDIRIDGDLIANNLNFRNATNFLQIFSGTGLNFTINDAASIDDSSPIYSQMIDIDATKNYMIGFSGIASASGYNPMVPISFNVFDNATLTAPIGTGYNMLGYHGVTDAPTVDVQVTELGATLFDNVGFGSFDTEGYVSQPGANYTLVLADQNGIPLPGLNFCTQLTAGTDANITYIASGFLNPANNSGGAQFGLFTVGSFAGAFTPVYVGTCAAPENDNACSAQTIIVNAPPIPGGNLFSTLQDLEVAPPATSCEDSLFGGWCPLQVPSNTVWYNFVADPSGIARITTCLPGTNLDTQIAVYLAGDCNDFASYTFVAANDDQIGLCADANIVYASTLEMSGLTPGATYYIMVDGYGTSTNSFFIEVTAPVGVAESAKKKASIYPNPVKNVLTVSNFSNGIATVYNAEGQIVITKSINGNNQIDVNSLSNGLYFIRLSNASASEMIKFIKE